MKMTDGLDEGPVYFFHKQKILHKDNRNTLEEKLTSLAIKNIDKDLSDIYFDKLTPIKQGLKKHKLLQKDR